MIRKVLNSLTKLAEDWQVKTLVLGVSGGADSIALLVALAELQTALGVNLVAVHVNHKTRGRASDGDASFVKKTCRALGVKCVVKTVDVPALARGRKISLEMAARDTRYECFVQQAKKEKSSAIVTAHTKDDQAETVVLKLARGAGMKGLAGIPPAGRVDGVNVLRPLLSVSRAEVVSFLRHREVMWREDASNVDQSYLRNRVRAKVLPLLASTLNPDICDTLARTSDVLRQDDDLLENLAEGALDACRIEGEKLDLGELRQEHRALVRRVLIMWLVDCGVRPEVVDLGLVSEIEKLIDGKKANASTSVTGGFHVVREYDSLGVVRSSVKKAKPFMRTISIPGKVRIGSAGLVVEAALGNAVIRERGRPGTYPATATVSRKAVGRKKLVVRSVSEGDRIKPMGMNGTRKLKDIFIDLKIPAAERQKLPVVECAGEIIWVPGYRVARGWGVEAGERVVKISLRTG